MLIHGIQITKGLIIDEPWISMILSGKKIWEMRSTRTKVRGHIALIKKGTGTIVGIAELTDSGVTPMTLSELIQAKHNHCVDYEANPQLAKWCFPWHLSNVRQIEPIPYVHKQGAVIWVNL